jgi:hypothetical protein
MTRMPVASIPYQRRPGFFIIAQNGWKYPGLIGSLSCKGKEMRLKKKARKVSVLRLSEFGYLIIVTGRYLQ